MRLRSSPDRPADRLLKESPRFFDGPCSKKAACADLAREELYDLSVDPFEEKNLLPGSLSSPEARALDHLRALLTKHLSLAPAYRRRLMVGGPLPGQLDDPTREALRALGYVQ